MTRSGPRGHVVLAHHDEAVRDGVARSLRQAGLVVEEVGGGHELRCAVISGLADVAILDTGDSALCGISLVRRLRSESDAHLIVIPESHGLESRLEGLRSGADDVVPQPMSLEETTLRVMAALRCVRADSSGILVVGPLSMNDARREVMIDGRHIDLTALEYDLLSTLARSPRRVISKAQLLRQVWGIEPEWQSEHTVTEHIHRLRRKLAGEPDIGRWIHTKRGVGYRFVPHTDD